MDIAAFFKILFSTGSALLPGTTALWWALHLGWAIVLGCGVRSLAGRFAWRHRSALGWLTLIWTLLPGALSPAYWLGLVFQSPSLMSVFLCMGWLLQQARRAPNALDLNAAAHARSFSVLQGLGVLLGWVLLLDTLAWFPVSVYAWGFGAGAVAVAAVMAALFWLQQGTRASGLPFCVLALFALTRLPSGNLWDALLDPLLWLTLQFGWLFSALRRRWPAATRV